MIYKKTKFASYVEAYVEQKYFNANILLMSISDNIFYCSLFLHSQIVGMLPMLSPVWRYDSHKLGHFNKSPGYMRDGDSRWSCPT